ncbi:MFS transporter [Hydrogenophaga sp. 2FB]|uniref:MFS transporter n=1 Tax=Hydrogenophaga sp. 2FB TaxID=2502187 RepID=UPI0010F7A351|nr:MFS transporter [Hydrogenophaga sp. 2FB]
MPAHPAPTENTATDPAFRTTVWALGLGGFAIGTGEFVIMGLLPEVATSLAVSIPQAGHVISAYALGVVVGAPLLAILTAHWPRRMLLVVLMVLFGLGNLASAAAPGYWSLNLLRFIAGMPHGTYFGVASLVAASLVPPGRRAQAVGLMMLGLTGATLIGVPMAAWLGQHWGWRSAFVLVGVIALLASVLIHRALPHIPAPEGASPLRELGALKNAQVWLTLGTGAIGFGGMFAVFSYIKPTLIEVTGLSLGAVPLVLALFGVGMIAGNLVGARLADKALLPTIGGTLVWSALVLLLMQLTAPHAAAVSFNVLLVGTVVALAPALQIRLMDVAGDAQALAAALNHSAFNLANALGAWLGGLAIAAGLGWTSTGWVGALLAVGGMVVFAASMWLQRRRSAPLVAATQGS